jgi:phosphate-selective porin
VKKSIALLFAGVVAGCATPPPPGSKEEAVNKGWEQLCKSGYCEGYAGTIVSRTENTLTVTINGNTRYMKYTVTGEPGHYVAQVRPTADSGRVRP